MNGRLGRLETRLAVLAFPGALAGAMGIAFAPIFVRLSEVGPVATGFWRLALALPLLWLWRRLESANGAARAPLSAADHRLLAVGGLLFAADLAFWHWSIALTTVANATLLANLAPLFVAAASFLLFGERFGRVFLIGLACALAGAGLLLGASFEVSMTRVGGDALGVATALCYAGYIVAVGRMRGRLSAAAVMLWTGLWSAAALLILAVATGERILPVSAEGWLVLAGLAVICQVVGQSLIAFSLAHLPAAMGAVSLLAQPVAAAALAWVLFAERLGPLEFAGAAVVLIGIAAARMGSELKSRR